MTVFNSVDRLNTVNNRCSPAQLQLPGPGRNLVGGSDMNEATTPAPAWLSTGVLPEELIARIRGALHDLEVVIFEANKWIAEHGPMFADYDASVRALPEGVADVLDETTGIRTLSHRLGVLSERLRAVDELRGDEQAKVIEQARADHELAVAVGGHTEGVARRIDFGAGA